MSDPTAEHPQDAPATQPVGSPPTEGMRTGPTTSWPTWRPGPTAPDPASASAPEPAPARTEWTPPPVPPPAPTSTPTAPRVRHAPPPTGPNWGLVLLGALVVVVAAGIVANQAAGFRVSDVSTFGPGVFVLGGLLCALVGLVGIVSRRRR